MSKPRGVYAKALARIKELEESFCRHLDSETILQGKLGDAYDRNALLVSEKSQLEVQVQNQKSTVQAYQNESVRLENLLEQKRLDIESLIDQRNAALKRAEELNKPHSILVTFDGETISTTAQVVSK
jgi:hypothetical protein